MVGHIEDSELNKLKVGQVFTRKERIAIEGKDGYATGEHFHIVVGRGKFRGSGWVKILTVFGLSIQLVELLNQKMLFHR